MLPLGDFSMLILLELCGSIACLAYAATQGWNLYLSVLRLREMREQQQMAGQLPTYMTGEDGLG